MSRTSAASFENPSGPRALFRRFARNKLAVIGLAFFLAVILAAVFAPLITPYDYASIDLSNTYSGVTPEHIFGTDQFGRDTFTRVIYGARSTLKIGFFSMAIAGTVGLLIGVFAGYYGGWFDNLVMRIIDIFAPIPYILVVVILSVLIGNGVANSTIAIGVSAIPDFARVMRATTLEVMGGEFIEAERCLGAKHNRIIFRHVIPNVLGTFVVQMTTGFSDALLAVTTIGYIGLGANPPHPEWGQMIYLARTSIYGGDWILALFPGLAIMLTILAVNLIGNGLRDMFDPRTAER